MNQNKIVMGLSLMAVWLVWFCAGMGLFYSNGGSPRWVESIYGETIQLWGNGIYANDSTFKATIAKGSDLVVLLVSFLLLLTTIKRNTGEKTKLLHGGFLASILYYSATTAFGVAYSKMFLAYVLLFSVSLFAFLLSLMDLNKTIRPVKADRNYTGTAIFTMLGGCTTLVWLMSILPTVLANAPLDIIGIYTTEPTFIIDMGINFPVCILGGVLLLKKRPLGYILPPMMLTFLTVIAVVVVGQSAVQLQYGIVLSLQQIIGYVASFVVFGLVAAMVNAHFLLTCWPKSNPRN